MPSPIEIALNYLVNVYYKEPLLSESKKAFWFLMEHISEDINSTPDSFN